MNSSTLRHFMVVVGATMAAWLVPVAVAAAAQASEGEKAEFADALEADFQLRIEEPQRWSATDLESLYKGAQALPEATWAVVGPMTIAYGQGACSFSMGRYSESCPTFGDDGRRFYIYDAAPLRGEGPVERLEILTAEEQRDIQLRRAVVHLAMVGLDRQFKWSESRRWQGINGWSRGGNRPLNEDPWGYSRYLGMRSARLDMVTFAEEYFVRPEDLLIDGADGDPLTFERLAAVDPNATVACQQFTHRRILTNLLQELDSQWEEPPRVLPHEEVGQPRCPAFDQWARPDLVAGFDLLLAAATANQPESLFGHLLLHVRYDTDGRVRGEGFEPVYQFGAVTETDVNIFRYLTRGVLGGFPSVFELYTFRGIDRMFLQHQQRNLERYSLQLTGDQKVHFLQRIWEAERRIRYPYAFFSKNCASFLIDLLAPVVDVEASPRRINIVMPTDVLDDLARVDNANDEPLLVKRPDTLRSNRDVAEEAVRQRRALVGKFIEATESGPLYEDLMDLVATLDTVDPVARRQAYEEAPGFFDRLIDAHPRLRSSAVDFLYHSVLVERYFMEMAHFARRAVDARVKGDGEHYTIDEQLARRRDLYRIEDLETRIEALNAVSVDDESAEEAGAQRPLTEEEEQILRFEERVRKTYLRALEVQAGLIDRHVPNWSGVAYLDERSQRYYEDKRRLDELSEGASGRNRLRLGAGWESATATPSLGLSYSMMEEHLGEVRRRGYSGDLGTRILGLDARAPVDPEFLENLQLDLVLFSYESLENTQGPLRRGILDMLGWGLDARIIHDGRRNLWAAGELDLGLYLPLASSQYQVDHLVLFAGPALRYDVHRDSDPMVGGTAGIFGQVHLYGRYSNRLRAGIETTQVVGLGPQWRYDVSARLESRHVLWRWRRRPLTVVPYAEGLWSTRDYRQPQASSGFSSWQAGLRLELPL